jgi:replicative DNA helicase
VGKEQIPSVLEITAKVREEFEKDELPVYDTGFHKINQVMGGIMGKMLTVLAARQGDGKTTLCLQIAAHIAKQHPVLFYSLDMDAGFMWIRLACNELGTEFTHFRWGMTKSERAQVLKKADELAQQSPNLHIYSGRTTTDDIWRHTVQYEPVYIVVDYITKLADNGAENTTQQLGKNMDGLRNVTRLGPAVWVLSQLNRAREHTKDKRPYEKDIRASGEIAEAADDIWFIYRDEVYNPESVWEGVAEFYPDKNRGGAGNVKAYLNFEGGRFFEEITADDVRRKRTLEGMG